ncbi:MAG TPA: EI24 domain-containing protein [Flavobacteriales bacterium]|nr:EI24 domain-containing protein [Flavobacteriales bacterium]
MNGFGKGLSTFGRAFGFALRHGMGWMFLVPVLLFAGLVYGFFQVLQGPMDELTAWLSTWLALPPASDDGSTWAEVKAAFDGVRDHLVALLVRIAVLFMIFKVNKYLVLILLAPLLAYASERTEEVLTGRTYPFSWVQLARDAFRGAIIAARNGVLELGISVGVWVATLLLPWLAPFSFVILFAVSSYFYGFSMVDYVFERRRMRIGESVRAVNARLGLVLANGALFNLVMKLPLFGIMFGPAMAAIGASMAVVEEERRRVARP